MRPKSIIEKIIIVNKVSKHSYDEEKLLYKKYLPKDDFNNLEELEKIFKNSKECTQNKELKLGLEIILTLISHKNEDIKNSALGKIYFLVDDENVQEIIIKELKNRSHNKNEASSTSAQYSLDLIALEVHKLKIFEIIFKILAELRPKVDKIKFSLIIPSSPKTFSKEITEIRSKNEILYPNNLTNRILRIFRVLNRRIDRMIPYFEEIENIHYENLIKHEMNSYHQVSKLEFSKEESLQRLANYHAQTFKEKGHLRRLIALLDDEDYNIQQIGVNALTDILKALLNNSNQKFLKPLSNPHLDESLEITV
jgi:hypothetical protein